VVDLFEEARTVELDERLATGRRGTHRPDDLLAAATAAGMAALTTPSPPSTSADPRSLGRASGRSSVKDAGTNRAQIPAHSRI
jgi:hypothetical protein